MDYTPYIINRSKEEMSILRTNTSVENHDQVIDSITIDE
jgi:hypothetical protein